MTRLENWSIVDLDADNPYLAPELHRPALHGTIFDDDRFSDGTVVTTSAITAVDQRKVRTKSGTIYYLGRVSEEYEKAYPGRNLDGPYPITFK